jgi:hypothetical protein
MDLALCYKTFKLASKNFSTICDAYKKNTQARRLQLQDAFWMTLHNPNQLIVKWIARISNGGVGPRKCKTDPC